MLATEEQQATVNPQGGYFAKKPICAIQNTHDPKVDDSLKTPPSPAAVHRMEEGNVYEDHIEQILLGAIFGSKTSSKAKAAHRELVGHANVGNVRWNRDGTLAGVFLTGDRTPESKTGREQATIAAMDLGVRFLWNARLPADLVGSRISEPDFLVRGTDRSDGRPGYLPGDVKHHKALDGGAKPRPWLVAPFDALDLDAAIHSEELGEGTPRRDDALQLAHYYRHLEALGYDVETDQRQGLLIGKEPYALVHELDAPWFDRRKSSAMELYDLQFTERISLVSDLQAGQPALLPMTKRTECGECDFRVYCDTVRKTTGDISRVKGVTRDQAQIHASFGMTTVSDLARLDVATALLVDAGIDVEELIVDAEATNPAADAGALLLAATTHVEATKTQTDRQDGLIEQLARAGVESAADLASLCEVTARYTGSRIQRLAVQIDRARVLTVGQTHLARGSLHAAIPRATIELHVDIEDNGGFIYLIGVKAFGQKKKAAAGTERRRSEFHGFCTWDTSEDAEASVIADWWEYMTTMKSYGKVNKWSVKAYCYTKHERVSLLKKAEKYAGKPGIPTVEALTVFFDAPDWVDLHEVLERDVIMPAEDVTLKTVASKVCGHVWADEDPSGGNSMAWYADAVGSADAAIREENRERLLTYNGDDCHATYAVAEWSTQNGDTHRPGKSLPPVSDLDALFSALRHAA